MTTPYERQRAILQTGAFLRELANDPGYPDSLRREANRLLRHFPRRRDLQMLGSVAELPLPTDEQEAEWLRGYPHGAHDPP